MLKKRTAAKDNNGGVVLSIIGSSAAAALFLGSVVAGFQAQTDGFLGRAVMLYFIGFILLGVTKKLACWTPEKRVR